MKEYILEVRKILSPTTCKKVIKYFDDENSVVASFKESDGRIVQDRSVRNCKTRDILHPETFGQKIVSNHIQDIFFAIGRQYKEKYSSFGFTKLSQLDILKYEANNHDAGYIYHIDHGPKVSERSISISLCLNNEFQGGEFLFNLPEGEIQYPQNVGDAIAFPSNFMFPHQVKKVLKGTRYALIGWLI